MNLLKTNKLLFFAAVAAHIPIAIEYTMRMWRSGHYQFFPLVILVIGYLMYAGWDRIETGARRGSAPVTTFLYALVLLLVGFATLLNTSFVGAISMFLLVVTAIYGATGWKGLTRAAPLLLVLLFIVPLPARIDERLVFFLQMVSSHLASWILDGVGQTHFREGVVLVTEKQQFMTEEACSGVRSLFSSLAAIAIYCAINRYGIFRYGLNLLQTIGWVVIGNAIRVAVVVFVTDNYSDIVASGRGHEFLGLVIFWFILLMAISTDHLFKSMVPVVDEEFDGSPPGEHHIPDMQAGPSAGGWLNGKLPMLPFSLCLAVLFSLTCLGGLKMAYARQTLGLGNTVIAAERLPFPVESDMPEAIGTWQRTDYIHENRGTHNLQAEDSFIWTYSLGDLQAKVSIDCPWQDWHDLSNCYTGLGWDTENNYFYGDDREDPGYTRIDLSRVTGETGVVFFCSIDRHGNEVKPQFSSSYFSADSVTTQMLNNLELVTGGSSDTTLAGIALPASTLQLICLPKRDFSAADLETVENLFLEARKQLVQTSRYTGSGKPETE